MSLPSTLTCLSHTGHQVASHDYHTENRTDYKRLRRLETGVRIQILASGNERVSLRRLSRNGYFVISPIYRFQKRRIISQFRPRITRYLIIRWHVATREYNLTAIGRLSRWKISESRVQKLNQPSPPLSYSRVRVLATSYGSIEHTRSF